MHEPDYKHLIAFLKAMEFNTLTRRVAEKSGHRGGRDRGGRQADVGLGVAVFRRRPSAGTTATCPSGPPPATLLTAGGGGSRRRSRRRTARSTRPPSSPAAHLAAARAGKFDRGKYETVRTLDRLKAWVLRAKDIGFVALDTETTSIDPMTAQLCGFSLAVADNEACYVPIGHRDGGKEGGSDLFAPEAKLAPNQIPEKQALETIQELLEDPGVTEDRPGPEIRLADFRAARDRGASLRRHHADVLRARRRQGRARPGRARRTVARPPAHPVRAGHRHRQEPGDVRRRDDREGRASTRPKPPTSRCGCGRR